VPDLQRAMNQGGATFTDIFHTSVMTPPTSVLVIPLHQDALVFGVLYAMSSTKTNFDGISNRLCQICHIIGPHLFSLLCSNAAAEYQVRPGTHIQCYFTGMLTHVAYSESCVCIICDTGIGCRLHACLSLSCGVLLYVCDPSMAVC
jgi:hypothetical protein